eukprot:Rhum_TRINITY_DN13819_c1_g1::Rhum_TRINITY_DN13819_c1_g1_i1::g.64759::m.64759
MPEVCTECGEVPRGPLCSKGRNAGFPHQVAAPSTHHHHHTSSRSRGRSPDAIRSKSPPSPSSRRGGVPSFVKHPPGSGHHLPSPAAASQAGSAYPQPPPSLRSSSRRKRSRSRRSRSRSGSRSGRSGAGGGSRRRRRSSSRRSRSGGAGGRSSGSSTDGGSSTRRSRSRRSGSRRSHGSRRSQSPRGHHHSYAKSPTSPPLVGTVKWQPGGSGGAPPSALHHHDPAAAAPSTPGFRSAYDRLSSGGAGTFGGGDNFGSATTTAPPRIWVGASVERNPGYWEAGNQDGGAGNRGTVVDCGDLWVKVRWHNAGEGTHRWGADGAFDVSIVSDVAPPADEVVQRETTGSRQIVQSVGARDRYSATPSHGGSAGAGQLPMPVALPPSQHAAA